MASAVSPPMRVFATFAVIAGVVGISQLNLAKIMLNTFTGPGSYSRIFAIFLILLNLKNFPYVWHIRVWGAVLKHFLFTLREFRVESGGPAALFQPSISSSRSPITECDYNIHKSNSTYFSDLDVSRTHLVSSLFRRGIQDLQKNTKTKLVRDPATGKVVTGKWYIMLGAAHCSFKREIKPYAKYEMWTRLLCWDRKWIYVVTHFVKPGTVKPDGYTLDTGRIFGRKPVKPRKTETEEEPAWLEDSVPSNAIYASALSKYVVKLGRLTIHPEVLFDACGLLPSKPGGWASMDGSVRPSDEEIAKLEAADKTSAAPGEWTWRRIVKENERGMKYAQHFAALDALHETFTGENRPAIGEYRDCFW